MTAVSYTHLYLSHLDLMRVFQRAFKRADIMIWHSQGFSPRAYVSIALPLPVGSESVCEILDFEIQDGSVAVSYTHLDVYKRQL